MTDILSKPVLLTGASGNIGSYVARKAAEAGWTLRLTDLAPFPGELPERATFTKADLGSAIDMLRLAEGCGLIVHFGGASHAGWSFEDILNANLRGLYHVYEAARRERARVVFASSNHAIGFHERTTRLDVDCELRPDSFYGLSKAYGELMGRMYWMKHGVESIQLRIGSCFPEPSNARMLSMWLSYDDLARLVVKCGEARQVGYEIIWGASDNARTFWGRDDREAIGWAPQDSVDAWTDALAGIVTDNPTVEKYQGGADVVRG